MTYAPERFTSAPPDDPAAQLRWLVDRALIGDLLTDAARRIDDYDQVGAAANFTEDGVLDLPFGIFAGREAIAAMGGFQPPMGTQHLSTNHMVQIDGDMASSRSYLLGTHVADLSRPERIWQAGGWYDCEYRRTDAGWKFTRVTLSVRWAGGDPAGAVPISRDKPPGGPRDQSAPTPTTNSAAHPAAR